jgi:hypothetical protein
VLVDVDDIDFTLLVVNEIIKSDLSHDLVRGFRPSSNPQGDTKHWVAINRRLPFLARPPCLDMQGRQCLSAPDCHGQLGQL